ncbi:MAG: hypothetical protein K8I60_11135 [Anaerolineae bacterium]|nr:hypothetical protein [Anaerolineae bacterium]
MKRIRKWFAIAVYSVALVVLPMAYSPVSTLPAQPGYQMVCTGTYCGTCC